MDLRKIRREYKDSEYSIKIIKEKGESNSIQVFNGTLPEILTGFASGFERLIHYGFMTVEDMENVIEMVKLKIDKK